MEPLLLAQGGRTDFALVLPSHPTPAQAFAGGEFARLFYEITGARLPRRTQKDPVQPKEIVLGLGVRPCLRLSRWSPPFGERRGTASTGTAASFILPPTATGGFYTGFTDFLRTIWAAGGLPKLSGVSPNGTGCCSPLSIPGQSRPFPFAKPLLWTATAGSFPCPTV